MGLIKIFSGNLKLASSLKDKLEEKNIDVVLKDNNQANSLSSNQVLKAVELFIQETNYSKANPIIEDFRMSI